MSCPWRADDIFATERRLSKKRKVIARLVDESQSIGHTDSSGALQQGIPREPEARDNINEIWIVAPLFVTRDVNEVM